MISVQASTLLPWVSASGIPCRTPMERTVWAVLGRASPVHAPADMGSRKADSDVTQRLCIVFSCFHGGCCAVILQKVACNGFSSSFIRLRHSLSTLVWFVLLCVNWTWLIVVAYFWWNIISPWCGCGQDIYCHWKAWHVNTWQCCVYIC